MADLTELTVTVEIAEAAIPEEADGDIMHPFWDKVDDLQVEMERDARRALMAWARQNGIGRGEVSLEVRQEI